MKLNLAGLITLLVLIPTAYGAAEGSYPESEEVMSSHLCADGLEADLAPADQHWLLGRLMSDFKGAERKALAAYDDEIEARHLMIAAQAADASRSHQLYQQLYEPIIADLSRVTFKAEADAYLARSHAKRGLAAVGIDGRALLERSRQRVFTKRLENTIVCRAVTELKFGVNYRYSNAEQEARVRQKVIAGVVAPYEAQRAAIKIQQAIRQHQRQIRATDVARAIGK